MKWNEFVYSLEQTTGWFVLTGQRRLDKSVRFSLGRVFVATNKNWSRSVLETTLKRVSHMENL